MAASEGYRNLAWKNFFRFKLFCQQVAFHRLTTTTKTTPTTTKTTTTTNTTTTTLTTTATAAASAISMFYSFCKKTDCWWFLRRAAIFSQKLSRSYNLRRSDKNSPFYFRPFRRPRPLGSAAWAEVERSFLLLSFFKKFGRKFERPKLFSEITVVAQKQIKVWKKKKIVNQSKSFFSIFSLKKKFFASKAFLSTEKILNCPGKGW